MRISIHVAFTRSTALYATVGNHGSTCSHGTATDLGPRIGGVAPENAVTHGSVAAAGSTQAAGDTSRTILHKGAVDHSGTAAPALKPASSAGSLIPGENAVDDG